MNDFEILPSVEVLIFLGASPVIASCFRLGHQKEEEEESFEYSVHLAATKKSSMRKNHPKIKHQSAYYFIDPEVPTNSNDETDPSTSNNSAQPSLDEEESTSLLNLSNTRVLVRRKRFAGVAPLAFLLIVGLLVGLKFVFLDDIVRKFSFSNSTTNEDQRTATTSAPSTSAVDIEETSSPVAKTLMPSPATTVAPSLPAIPSPTGTPSDSPTKELAPTSAPMLGPTNSPTSEPTLEPTISLLPTAIPVEGCQVLDYQFFEQANDMMLDILDDGYSAGDVFLFEPNDLFVDLQLVGQSRGRCVVLEALTLDNNVYCTVEWQFDGGTILLQGVLFELAVVGGTGCYSGFQGWIDMDKDPNDSDKYRFQFIHAAARGNTTCPQNGAAALLVSPWFEVGPNANGEPTDALIDWDENGSFSAGDIVVFDTNAFVTTKGAQGFVEGECMGLYDPVANATDPERPFCTMTFYTEGSYDILMVQGVYDNMVITSALGCFDGISGIVSGTALESGSFRYDLILDDNNNIDANNTSSCPSNTDIFNETWKEEAGDLLVNYMFDPPNDDLESSLDDDFDKYSPGDAYVFDNKFVSVNSTNVSGIGSGRCVFLDPSRGTFCSLVFQMMNDMGSIALQGDFTEMVVVGSSGCFQGLQGKVYGVVTNEGYTYTWDVTV